MKDNAIINYLRGSVEELGRVTWPTRNQAVKLTGIVLVFCLLVAIFLGALDYGLSQLYNYILGLTA